MEHVTKKKVLVVGAGYMGKVHAKAYSRMEGVQLAAVVDQDVGRCRDFSGEFGCDALFHLDTAIKGDFDFIDICLPTRFHKELVIKSFMEGKDVICEKPIALCLKEAEDMVTASVTYGRKFMIAHVVRFWPEYYKLSQMIKNGELKDIYYITLSRYGAPPQWSAGNWMLDDGKSGGIIFDLSIHDIDYAISLLGMPRWVFARRNVINGNYTAYLNTILGYENVNVFLESGFIMKNTYPFTTGFRVSTPECVLEYVNKSGKGLLKYSDEHAEGLKMEYEDYDPYQKELEYFVNCVTNGTEPETGTGYDGMNAVKLAELIALSAKTNEKVFVY